MDNDELNELRLQVIRAQTRVKKLQELNDELLGALHAINEACRMSPDPLARTCLDIAQTAIVNAIASVAAS